MKYFVFVCFFSSFSQCVCVIATTELSPTAKWALPQKSSKNLRCNSWHLVSVKIGGGFLKNCNGSVGRLVSGWKEIKIPVYSVFVVGTTEKLHLFKCCFTWVIWVDWRVHLKKGVQSCGTSLLRPNNQHVWKSIAFFSFWPDF